MKTPAQAKDTVVERAGGAPALADRLGIKRQAVYQWKKIPPERVPQIAALLDMPRHEIRPDLYEDPADLQPAGAA